MTAAENLTEPEFRALHALRVKGAATADDVHQFVGGDGVERVLGPLEDGGLVTSRAAGDMAYFALSPAGRERHRFAVARRLDDEARARLAAVYDDRFLAVNVRFKRLCAEWQREESFELIEEAVDVHEEIGCVLSVAASSDARFARYAERLDTMMEAFQEGDAAALAAPVGESYHNVWFELHEDLLVTLGRDRANEAS